MRTQNTLKRWAEHRTRLHSTTYTRNTEQTRPSQETEELSHRRINHARSPITDFACKLLRIINKQHRIAMVQFVSEQSLQEYLHAHKTRKTDTSTHYSRQNKLQIICQHDHDCIFTAAEIDLSH